MNDRQKQLIRESWAQVAPIADTAAALFYERLFTLDPRVAPLFSSTDMVAQGRMLMQTLAIVVKSLDSLETIVPAVQAMGRRHVGYGVRPEDYDTVGAALLWTLEQGLGEAATAETLEAWGTAYGILAGVMKDAAQEAEAVAA